ncbi:MAG TPA: glycosyltransferase family 2 protein [Chloroflexota bacterium]|nr:glycosyltransferase family 2 protein [Chloroflexota bacterium]
MPKTSRPRPARVSVVIPALNEADNLPHVLPCLPDGIHEFILVDGNSSDSTIEVARQLRPDVKIAHETRGKGAAMLTGFETATGDYVVALDADGSMDPAEIERFVGALDAGADFAKGSRYLPGAGSDDISLLRSLGNAVLLRAVRWLFGGHFTDLCYGYVAFRKDALPKLGLDCTGFEIETLMNIRALKAGITVTEVPSYEKRRIIGESRLNAFRDGLRILRTIVRERLHGRMPVPAAPAQEARAADLRLTP